MRFPALLFLAAFAGTVPLALAKSPAYEAFKASIEPIFAKARPGHARCIVCHSADTNPFHLEPPAAGGVRTEEGSRRNFQAVLRLINPDNPAASRLLLHPLAPDAGGDEFHSGGHQFLSRDDPDWKAIAAWIAQGKDAMTETARVVP